MPGPNNDPGNFFFQTFDLEAWRAAVDQAVSILTDGDRDPGVFAIEQEIDPADDLTADHEQGLEYVRDAMQGLARDKEDGKEVLTPREAEVAEDTGAIVFLALAIYRPRPRTTHPD